MYTQLDNAFKYENKYWCRDCSYATKKHVEKLKLSIYCSNFDDVFPAFEKACGEFKEDGNRRFATGQGLLKFLKEKKERKEAKKGD